MAGTMRSGTNIGLPKDHWIHKAVAKEKGRMAKKNTGPARSKEAAVNTSAVNSAPPQGTQENGNKTKAVAGNGNATMGTGMKGY